MALVAALCAHGGSSSNRRCGAPVRKTSAALASGSAFDALVLIRRVGYPHRSTPSLPLELGHRHERPRGPAGTEDTREVSADRSARSRAGGGERLGRGCTRRGGGKQTAPSGEMKRRPSPGSLRPSSERHSWRQALSLNFRATCTRWPRPRRKRPAAQSERRCRETGEDPNEEPNHPPHDRRSALIVCRAGAKRRRAARRSCTVIKRVGA